MPDAGEGRCLCHGERCTLTVDDARHGTSNGYTNLWCRCEPCRIAHTEDFSESKARMRAKPIPEHLHGSSNCYGNYGCRCRLCTDAWSADNADRYHRRKQGLTDVAMGIMPAPEWRSPDRPHKRRSA